MFSKDTCVKEKKIFIMVNRKWEEADPNEINIKDDEVMFQRATESGTIKYLVREEHLETNRQI